MNNTHPQRRMSMDDDLAMEDAAVTPPKKRTTDQRKDKGPLPTQTTSRRLEGQKAQQPYR